MNRTEEVKNILLKIQAEDSDSFARFSSEHAICFTEANGDWLLFLYGRGQETIYYRIATRVRNAFS